MNHFISRLFLVMLLIASGSLLGFGQGGGTTSSITGVVVDASGGVIPGADVMIKNTATSAEFKAITADNGTFSVPGPEWRDIFCYHHCAELQGSGCK